MVGYSVERKRELHVRQLLLRGGGALAGGNSYGQATDLMLLAAYRFDEKVSEFLGYRRLATSYEVSCGFLFDAVAHRPRFGLDYHF